MKILTPQVQINQTAASVSSPPAGYISVFSEGGMLKQKESGGTVTTYIGDTGLTTPGSAGNVMTSNGTAWTSQPLSPPSSFTLDGGAPSTNYSGTLKIDFGGVS